MSESLATLHDDLQDLLGQTIAGRYRVGALIGVGGMAAVFRVQHLGLGRDMAIKVLHPQLSSHAEVSARFDREAKSASRLDHPNCVQVTDYGSTEQGMKFMIMQLLEGRELAHEMRDGPLEPLRALELTVQILRGLEHAHKQGVIHRDIKPENVFITRDHDGRETIKLVDFGIAKIVDATIDDKHKTLAGMVFGTPAYMSPEQAMGVDADARSDLYSTGVLLYQMLSGKLPFDNEDPVALVRMQVSADPEPLPPSVPPVLSATVARLLQKDRDRRFQSATEALAVLDALRVMLGGGEIESMVTAANTSGPIYIDSSRQIIVDPSGQVLVDASGQMSVLDPSQAMHVGGVGRWEQWRSRTTRITEAILARPRWQVYVLGGAAVVFMLALVMWVARQPSGKADGVASAATGDDDEATDEALEAAALDDVVGPDASALAQIDRLLEAKKVVEADALISPLRDEFPADPQLAWRQGKVLSLIKRKEAQALAAYGNALELDPALMDDPAFASELDALMRNPKVRDEALDLALQRMGERGHAFLIEQVNEERKPLGFTDRKRALAELGRTPASAEQVNTKLNLALDVLQASESITPCAAYRQALEAIAAQPDWYFHARVERAKVPEPPAAEAPHAGEEAKACEGLVELRAVVLEQLAALAPTSASAASKNEETVEVAEEETPAESSSAAASKSRKTSKRSKKPASSTKKTNCKKFGSMFKKDCWKKR